MSRLFSLKRMSVALVMMAAVASLSQAASIPQMINYQGTLTEPTGQLVPDGNYAIAFYLYDTPSGGDPLWSESWNGTTSPAIVTGGVFNVMLGAQNPIPAGFFSDHPVVYLGVKVGDDSEMMPRQRITSVGYAFTAGNGIPVGGIIMWSGAVDQVPGGWALCDGTNGTPDLRDRFVVGAGGGYVAAQTGGAATVNVSHDHDGPLHAHSMNNHTHSMQGHVHSVAIGPVGADGTSNGHVTVDWKDVGSSGKSVTGQHYHSTIVGGPSVTNTGSAAGNTGMEGNGKTGMGGSSSVENRPPFYALAFIMKL